MTREETKKLLYVICNTYPNFKPSNISMTVDIWFDVLQEFELPPLMSALKAYIVSDTSGFAPGISNLLSLLREMTEKDDLNELTAWDMVSRAVRDSNYHAQERFDELPKLVQDCVGSPSQLRAWASSDIKALETVIQSNFIKTFRNLKMRQEKEQLIKFDVSKAVEQKKNKQIGVGENGTD